ncbi:MAG: GNAT family N-acetyltransferase [Alphaproteobacteria bacterium]|nr:GNAT family N-acetyltransferase [Alphaproteobacteria bacterium]
MKLEQIHRQPVISSPRFDLRPLRATDAELVARYANDKRVAQMTTSIPFPLSQEAAAEFVARAGARDRDEDIWAIDASKTDGSELLGVISLKYLDRDQSEVGYWVAPEFWNQGYASAALACLLEANPHANRSVVACVFQDNLSSTHVLSGNGFACLGEAEAFSLSRAAHVPTWTYLKTLLSLSRALQPRR